MDYKDALIRKVSKFYLGDINEDNLRDYFRKWAKKNEYPLPKRIKFLKSTAYNDDGDIVPLVNETDGEVYYYDGCDRWCYLRKVEDKDFFKIIEE